MTPSDHRLWKTRRVLPRIYWLYKSLDAVLTAPLSPKGRPGHLLWSIVSKSTSNYNRVTSLLNLLDHLNPGLSQQIASSLLRFDNFPVDQFDVSLLAYGSGTTVFKLTNGQEAIVLKVFRRSLAGPAKQLWEVASEYKHKHATLTAWFNQQDEMVIPSTFLVLHGPLLGAAAAAVVQPYVAGKKSDLFLDYSEDEVIQLLCSTPSLTDQWQHFSRRFLSSMEETDTCFDLVGRENLMLVELEGRLNLKIVDMGIFDVPTIRARQPVVYRRLMDHIQRLIRISERMERV